MPTNLSLWRGIIGRAPRGPVIEICVRHKETHRFPIDSPQNTMWCVILMLQRTGTYWSFMCFAILHNSFPYKLKWPVSLYAYINHDLIKPISVSLSYNITFFCNDNIHRQKDSMQKIKNKKAKHRTFSQEHSSAGIFPRPCLTWGNVSALSGAAEN